MFFFYIVQVQLRENIQTSISFSSGGFLNSEFTAQPTKDDVDDHDDDDGIDGEDGSDDHASSTSSELFSCPYQGCALSFKRHSNLENHLAYGKCKLRKEKFTLEDKAKLLYVQKLAEGTSLQPQLHSTSTDSQGTTSLCQGWALRQVKKSGRFNDNQRSYLDEKFLIGQTTGIKRDPSQVARDLRHARTDSGERRFTIEEFLTQQQIKSYFSRKASKSKQVESSHQEETDALSEEDHLAYTSARDDIIKEIELNHPIIYDTYDICKMHAEKKLEKLSVALLRLICAYFNMEVEDLPRRRKAPYLSFINELVQSCSCNN